MTSFPTHYFLPANISNFLDSNDLITFSCENVHIYHTLQFKLEQEKKKTITEHIHYFYKPEISTISLHYGAQEYLHLIPILFQNLSTVFEFIQEYKVTYLDLSMETSHGGYCIQTLLDELRSNTTLINLNLGLFGDLLDRDILVEIMEDHPSLTYLTLNESHSLYKLADGTAVWSHFKP